jgi:hypothetical protein
MRQSVRDLTRRGTGSGDNGLLLRQGIGVNGIDQRICATKFTLVVTLSKQKFSLSMAI